MSLGLCWLMIVGGLLIIVVSARILVPAASEIALRIGVPDDVIAGLYSYICLRIILTFLPVF